MRSALALLAEYGEEGVRGKDSSAFFRGRDRVHKLHRLNTEEGLRYDA